MIIGEYKMKKMITIQKTIQQIPLEMGLNMCLKVLEKPKGISEKDFSKQIKQDLITGRKIFRVREIVIAGR